MDIRKYLWIPITVFVDIHKSFFQMQYSFFDIQNSFIIHKCIFGYPFFDIKKLFFDIKN